MTDLRQAAQMALTWFEWFHKGNSIESPVSSIQCSNSLRAALMSVPDGAEQSAKHREPVAWISGGGIRELQETGRTEVFAEKDYECLETAPLYTAPLPKAEPQEPVAWMYFDSDGDAIFGHPNGYRPDDAVPVYTAPPPAEREPLTDEELRNALRQCPHDTVENLRVRWLYAKDFARAIERAHGINVPQARGEQE